MSYLKSDPRIIKKRLAIRAKRGSVCFEIYPKKTNNHFYLVVYNCTERREVFAYSTLNLDDHKNDVNAAKAVGQKVASWCLENKIPSIYFNKLNYKFHGKLAIAVSSFNETFNK
jgi:ribosomal protein L18